MKGLPAYDVFLMNQFELHYIAIFLSPLAEGLFLDGVSAADRDKASFLLWNTPDPGLLSLCLQKPPGEVIHAAPKAGILSFGSLCCGLLKREG
jgi:hypothetical protein